MSADILKKPLESRSFHVGNFGSKGGLQRIAPLKNERQPSRSPNKKAQNSVQVTARDSSAKNP